MSDVLETDSRRDSPLTAMRRVWRLSVGLVVLGLVIGLGIGVSRPVSYQAEARVGVGSQSLGTNAVAGYVLAAQQLAADYARYVTLQAGRAVLATKLGPAAAAQVSSITASPIPDSTIIRIDVGASSRDLAVRAAGIVQTTLTDQINTSVSATTPRAVLAQYNTVNSSLVTAQAALSNDQGQLAELRAAGASLTAINAKQAAVNNDQVTVNNFLTQASALQAQYQSLLSQPQTANGLRIVAPAVYEGSNRRSLLERLGLIGLTVGALVALCAALWLDRRRVGVEPTPAGGVPDGLVPQLGPAAAQPTLPAQHEAAMLPAAESAAIAVHDLYVAQAMRVAHEREARELDRVREARRREVRNALQQQQQDSDARLGEYLAGQQVPGVSGTGDAPAPGRPAPLPEPWTTANGTSSHGGQQRPPRPFGHHAGRQIRVLSTSSDPSDPPVPLDQDVDATDSGHGHRPRR